MVSGKHRRPRAATFRGALLITLAALVTTIVAFTLQYLQTVQAIEDESRARVDAEAASLIARYDAGGIRALAIFLNDVDQKGRVRDFLYLLATADGRLIAGNLLTWPAAISGPGQYSFRTTVISSRGSEQRWAEARAVVIGPGYRLLVGELADTRLALQERYLASLLWSLSATALVGLGLGWWLSRRAIGFVDRVADAGERLLAGNLSERLPVAGTQDEYDRLAEIINACFADLERTVESLRATTDGLAHDLKTPLTRIKARLALARTRSGDPSELAGALEATEADLGELLRAINDVLELARAESVGAGSFADVDLASIAAEAVELYRPLADEKDITLKTSFAPTPMSGVSSLLARLVTNLLDNAVKYTPSGGCIGVSTAADAGTARIVVDDTGPGISERDRDRAVARFVRLDASPSTVGSGLGLSLVAAIARVHRGTMRLSDNQPGLRVEITFDGGSGKHEQGERRQHPGCLK